MIAVEIIIPGNECVLEFNIPTQITFYELTELVVRAVSSLAKEDYNPEGAMLCNAQSGEIFNYNHTVEQEGLRNGSKLLLI